MAKLDADMQSLVRRTILCFAATINGDGSPNLSPKSTLIVHDDQHLLFANIASPRTVANLRREPRIEINCVDIFARRGYRFTGHASVRSAGDPIYDEVAAALRAEHGDAIPIHDAVLVRVLSAKPILSPAYAYVPGVTETSLREVYARKYGMVPLSPEESTQRPRISKLSSSLPASPSRRRLLHIAPAKRSHRTSSMRSPTFPANHWSPWSSIMHRGAPRARTRMPRRPSSMPTSSRAPSSLR